MSTGETPVDCGRDGRSPQQRVDEARQRRSDIRVSVVIALPKKLTQRTIRRDGHRDSLQQRDQLRRLVKPVREAGEIGRSALGIEGGEIGER